MAGMYNSTEMPPRSMTPVWAMFGSIGVIAVIGAFIALATSGGSPAPSGPGKSAEAAQPAPPKKSQTSWTHQELVDHLNRGGTVVNRIEAPAPKGSVAIWLVWGVKFDNRHAAVIQMAESGTWEPIYRRGCRIIYCQKHPTEEAARDEAGASDRCFAWGRFTFRGDPAFVFWIKAALR